MSHVPPCVKKSRLLRKTSTTRHVYHVSTHHQRVDREDVARLDQRDLTDGRCPEQVLRHADLRVDKPHPWGSYGVGERFHQV